MNIFPIFKNLQATSLFKAFIVNAIVAAIIATLTIELRFKLEDDTSNYYTFSKKLFNTEKLNVIHKIIIVFGSSFLVSFIIYHIMLLFFSYGGGMLTTKVFKKLSFFSYFDELV